MSVRKQAAPNMRLKKAPKPTNVGRVPKPKVFMLQTGTPRAFNDPVGFDSARKAKTAAMDFFRSWEHWCHRHNWAGLEAINRAVEVINDTPDPTTPDPVGVDCPLDEHTEVTLSVRLWKKAE